MDLLSKRGYLLQWFQHFVTLRHFESVTQFHSHTIIF